MKTDILNVNGPFESGNRFGVIMAEAPFRHGTEQTTFERLKSRLVQSRLDRIATPALVAAIHRAANAASAEVGSTGFSELFFPELFEEKAKLELASSSAQELSEPRGRNSSISLVANLHGDDYCPVP